MKITTLTTTTYEDQGQTFLAVPWQITEEDAVLAEGSQSFPLSVTGEEVRAFLSQSLQTYKDEQASLVVQQEVEAEKTAAETLASELSNLTVE